MKRGHVQIFTSRERAPRRTIIKSCDCCGLDTREQVEVRHRKTGTVNALWLCGRCIAGPDRAWRLAWEPVIPKRESSRP
jgi:hypothetical protein